MVDLGWPWWVTSLIACGVLTIAGAAALLAKRIDVRSAAALLAVEAAAIAGIAPFVMDARDSSSRSMSASGLTAAEFVRRADANCAAIGRAFAAAGNPETPGEIGQRLDRIMPAMWYRLAQQGMLVPPPAQRVRAQHWMHAMTAFAVDFESLGRSARNHDTEGIKAANARLSKSIARSTRLSRELGLKVCFS